jgi:hypothetical protein
MVGPTGTERIAPTMVGNKAHADAKTIGTLNELDVGDGALGLEKELEQALIGIQKRETGHSIRICEPPKPPWRGL